MTKQMIYIADDEKNIRNLLQDFLVSSGYEVQLFENVEDLLLAFEDNKPDLVILDIMMSGKDGLSNFCGAVQWSCLYPYSGKSLIRCIA